MKTITIADIAAALSLQADELARMRAREDAREARIEALEARNAAAPKHRPARRRVAMPGEAEIMAQAVEAASLASGISATRIWGRSQIVEVVAARHDAMHRALDLGLGYPGIARAMGRDPTTILHAIGKRYGAKK